MAYLSGRRLGAVSAIPHGHILGELAYRGFTTFPARTLEDARARTRLETEIMIALAGLAAEALHPGPVERAGAATDLQRALDLALVATAEPEEATAFVNWLFVRARNRLGADACRRAIRTLATELGRRGALTGADVRACLVRSFGSGQRRRSANRLRR